MSVEAPLAVDVNNDLTEEEVELLSVPSRRNAYIASFILLILLIGLWEWAVRAEVIPAIIVPPASEVGKAVIELVRSDFFFEHFFLTLQETLLGFTIGSGIALALGVVLGASTFLRTALSPYIVVFQTLPKVALAPVFVTWFGFGMTSKVVMSIVICFFPVFVNTLSGLAMVDEKALMFMRSIQATRWQIVRKLSIPSALPSIFAGLKTSATVALIGVIVGEFVGTTAGLGYLIKLYSFQIRVANVFALIAILGALGWLLYAVLDFADRRIVFWQTSEDHR